MKTASPRHKKAPPQDKVAQPEGRADDAPSTGEWDSLIEAAKALDLLAHSGAAVSLLLAAAKAEAAFEEWVRPHRSARFASHRTVPAAPAEWDTFLSANAPYDLVDFARSCPPGVLPILSRWVYWKVLEARLAHDTTAEQSDRAMLRSCLDAAIPAGKQGKKPSSKTHVLVRLVELGVPVADLARQFGMSEQAVREAASKRRVAEKRQIRTRRI